MVQGDIEVPVWMILGFPRSLNLTSNMCEIKTNVTLNSWRRFPSMLCECWCQGGDPGEEQIQGMLLP